MTAVVTEATHFALSAHVPRATPAVGDT